jgi:hypothetical protein
MFLPVRWSSYSALIRLLITRLTTWRWDCSWSYDSADVHLPRYITQHVSSAVILLKFISEYHFWISFVEPHAVMDYFMDIDSFQTGHYWAPCSYRPTYLNCCWQRWSSGYRACLWGFKPGRINGFLIATKILSTTSIGGEVKPTAPCRKILRYVKEPWGVAYETDISSAKFTTISHQVSSHSLIGVSAARDLRRIDQKWI